jgi:predicted phage tail protein
MKTILLYGFLGRQFGRVHHYDVKTPAEAIRALTVTLTGFKKALVDGGYYKVLIGGVDNVSSDRVLNPTSDRESIRIVPVLAGSGKAFVQILIGAALIYFSGGLAAGLQATGTAAGIAGATAGQAGLMGITSAMIAQVGVSLIIGGVSQILFQPKAAQSVDKPANKASYAFDGAVNTTAQGNPVPVLYGGPLIVGSQVISAGLSTEQI